MKIFVSSRGNVAVAPGVGGVLAAVVLAPFVLAVALLAAAVSGVAAIMGALIGHRVKVSSATLGRLGWTVSALIPLGLVVAFFGHDSKALVEVGLYTSLGAVPTSIALIAASVFVER
jgi:hypothetical protein